MYFIDVQGTLIDDDKRLPIDGAIDFVNYLNSNRIPYMVITNNTKHSSEEFLGYLVSLGFELKKENYIDPFSILLNEIKPSKVAAFGQGSFIKVLESFGFEIDFQTPEALIISVKQDYTNEDYAKMISIALKGVKIIGMHETSIYAKDNKKYPGVGAILKMVSFASNRHYTVAGKPSIDFYTKAKDLINAKNFSDITIVSDDMTGDILGARELGMKGVFVLSGKIKDANEILPTLSDSQKPEMVCENIGEFLKRLRP